MYLCKKLITTKKQKKMRKLFIYAITAFGLGLASCGSNSQAPAQQVRNNVTVTSAAPEQVSVESQNIPGFNMPNFANLLKSTTNPELLEKAINDTANEINSLNIDSDPNNIDYINVVDEKGDIKVMDGNTLIAKVTITTTNGQNTLNIAGNQQYSGADYNYTRPGITLSDYLLLSYMMHPHHYWSSPYSYGHYPRYYHSHRYYSNGYGRPIVSSRTRSTIHTTTTVRQVSPTNKTISPNTTAAKPVLPVKQTNLSNTNLSQRQFKANDDKTVQSGGFGKQKAAPVQHAAPVHNAPKAAPRSFGSSSGKSFGGGRSGGRGGRR